VIRWLGHDFDLFELQHLELIANRVEQFIGIQQIVRIAWLAEGFVPDREGLVNKQSAGADQLDDRRQDRPPQVVGHDDAGVGMPRERPETFRFKVSLDDRDVAAPAEVVKAGRVDIDECHRMSVFQQQSAMAAAAAGYIDDLSIGWNLPGKAQNPRGGRSRAMGRFGAVGHALIPGYLAERGIRHNL
jgi:hypothetical protein